MNLLDRHPHAKDCGCCLTVADMLESLKLGDKLDALHRLYSDLNGKADQIMAAQDDINAAVTAIGTAVTAIGAAVAAGIGGGTPASTAALNTAVTQLGAATTSLTTATPVPAAAAAEAPAAGQPGGPVSDPFASGREQA